MTHVGQQTSLHLGSRLQYAFFELLVRCQALVAARIILAVVVFYYTLLPHVRRRSRPYLEHRFSTTGLWYEFWHAYRLHLQFGHILLDRMVARVTGTPSLAAVEPELRERLTRAVRNPRGCIILSAHIGDWQLGLSGLEELGRPVNVVYLRDPHDTADKTIFRYLGTERRRIIDASDGPGALIEAAAALRRGEVCCLMGDRLIGTQDKRSVCVPFLNGNIRLPVNAYALASATGASLVAVFTVREKGGTRPVLVESLDVPQGLSHRDPSLFRPFALRFAQAMQQVTEQYPYQFFNFYNMWV